MARIQHNLGTLAHDLGDLETAKQRFEKSLTLFRDLGSQHHVAWTLNSLAGVTWQQGNVARTQNYAEDASVLLSASGDPIALAFHYFLALTAAAQGAHAEAHTHHLESVKLQHKAGNKHGLLTALEGLAAFYARDDAAQAVHLLSAVDCARTAFGIPPPPARDAPSSGAARQGKGKPRCGRFPSGLAAGGLDDAVERMLGQ